MVDITGCFYCPFYFWLCWIFAAAPGLSCPSLGMWDLSSPIRDQIHVLCIERQILNTTWEVPSGWFQPKEEHGQKFKARGWLVLLWVRTNPASYPSYKWLSVSEVAAEEEMGMGQGKAIPSDIKRLPQSAQLALCMHVQSLSHVWFFVTSWTVAHQAPLSMKFCRQEYWIMVTIPFSRGSSWPRNQTHISCISRRFLYHWAKRGPLKMHSSLYGRIIG